MFKRITEKNKYIKNLNIKDYQFNTKENKIKVKLFNKDIYLENDPWMWHLHLKLTNVCNANCFFCIESGCKTKEDPNYYVKKLDSILSEMNQTKILHSMSLTGGEPLLFKEFNNLIEVIKKYPISFLTMNTNGSYLENNLYLIDGLFDFVNISRHSIDDNQNTDIFKTRVPSIDELKQIKSEMKSTKMRIQYVITNDISYDDFLTIVNRFSFADDLSFRCLMETGKIHNVLYDSTKGKKAYTNILNNVYNDFNLIEQVLQDYYVYETWEKDGKQITFSYSNMNLLTTEEEKEDDSICREFILHPNGVFSGSWDYNKKIIN